MSFMPTDHYKVNEVIFEEGFPADGVYLICSGKVKIIKKRNDREIELARLGEGAIFGEMAFIDERPRSATVVAIEDTWCYKHNKDVFLGKIKALDPVLSKLFHDLVEVVREKSKAKVIIDHGSIHPSYDSDMDIGAAVNLANIRPSRSRENLMADKKIMGKVAELDLFMRNIFTSLVDISYR
jgi:CRP-like cAMP-binding protein